MTHALVPPADPLNDGSAPFNQYGYNLALDFFNLPQSRRADVGETLGYPGRLPAESDMDMYHRWFIRARDSKQVGMFRAVVDYQMELQDRSKTIIHRALPVQLEIPNLVYIPV